MKTLATEISRRNGTFGEETSVFLAYAKYTANGSGKAAYFVHTLNSDADVSGCDTVPADDVDYNASWSGVDVSEQNSMTGAVC